MRKKIVLLVIVVINIFMLTGCWNYVEINGQINVSGLAIDVGQQGKKYHLSAEVIVVCAGEQAGVKTCVIETDSDTVFEGIRNMMTLTTKKLYFGHCKALVISEEAAKNGIAEMLDMTIRNHEMRITTDVMISKSCAAKDILMTEGIANPSTAYKIYDLMVTSRQAVGESPVTKTYKVYNSIQNEGVCTVIPTLEIAKAEDKKLLKLAGVAVFDNDKLIGFLDEKQTKYLSFLNDKIERSGLLTFKAEENSNEFLSFEIYKNKTKRKLQFDGAYPSITFTVNTSGIIGELDIEADFAKPKEIEKVRQLLKTNLEKDLTELIDTAQGKLGCDIFGIGVQIQKDNPKMWDKYKDNWDETFKKMKIKIDCKVKITGSGIDNSSVKKELLK